MAYNFKKVAMKYKAWKDWGIGTRAIFKYRKMYKNLNSKYPEAMNHEAEYLEGDLGFKAGDIIGLNSAGSMSYAYNQGKFEKGCIFQLIYEGKQTNDAGTEYHAIDIQVDEPVEEVTNPQVGSEVKEIEDIDDGFGL